LRCAVDARQDCAFFLLKDFASIMDFLSFWWKFYQAIPVIFRSVGDVSVGFGQDFLDVGLLE
tara:strand:- start:476 stop:661 length:186 start_codon:yes stop_codon:yes gene_type:complete